MYNNKNLSLSWNEIVLNYGGSRCKNFPFLADRRNGFLIVINGKKYGQGMHKQKTRTSNCDDKHRLSLRLVQSLVTQEQ